MKTRLTALALAAAAAALSLPAAAGPIASVQKLWTFANTDGQASQPGDRFSSEIGAWDPVSRSLFIVGGRGIEVVDLAGNRLQTFDTTGLGVVNSIAIANGVAAVSFSNANASSPGRVEFFDTQTFRAFGGAAAQRGGVTVGAVPDMLTWMAGGTQLLVANEGERQSNANNPVGSLSRILFNAAAPSSSSVGTIGFEAFDGQEAALRAAGVRIQAGVSASVALEPEYIALSGDGSKAVVTLQENNAVAIIDLASGKVADIKGLGLKDFDKPGQRMDPSDRDNTITLRNVPVKGLYMPDSIASYVSGGKSFYVLANEGDAFVDDSDVARLAAPTSNSDPTPLFTLDPSVFNGANSEANLKNPAVLGRLNVVRNGATGDGGTKNMTEIVTIGARSFSILDENGHMVFESGDSLEVEAIAAGLYVDNRSDDKGVEPEGVAIFHAAGRTIAAIGLERTSEGAIALYDVTDPGHATFLQFIRSGSAAAFRTEGITVFEDGGRTYLAMHNEDSGDLLPNGRTSNTTLLFEILAVPEPGSLALLLAALPALGWARRRPGR